MCRFPIVVRGYLYQTALVAQPLLHPCLVRLCRKVVYQNVANDRLLGAVGNVTLDPVPEMNYAVCPALIIDCIVTLHSSLISSCLWPLLSSCGFVITPRCRATLDQFASIYATTAQYTHLENALFRPLNKNVGLQTPRKEIKCIGGTFSEGC
jgi:hypothetical protein